MIRYIPPADPSSERNYLTGYGVALDLKKMDYLALDDRRSQATSALETSEGGEGGFISNDLNDEQLLTYGLF